MNRNEEEVFSQIGSRLTEFVQAGQTIAEYQARYKMVLVALIQFLAQHWARGKIYGMVAPEEYLFEALMTEIKKETGDVGSDDGR